MAAVQVLTLLMHDDNKSLALAVTGCNVARNRYCTLKNAEAMISAGYQTAYAQLPALRCTARMVLTGCGSWLS